MLLWFNRKRGRKGITMLNINLRKKFNDQGAPSAAVPSKPSMPPDDRPETRLYRAVRAGNLSDVIKFLKAGDDPNVPNSHGRTPLHAAAYLGETRIVRELLWGGAHVDVPDWKGRTPLHSAAIGGGLQHREEIIKMLLQRKADFNRKDHLGWTAKDFMDLWYAGPSAAEKIKELKKLEEENYPRFKPPLKPPAAAA